MTKEQILAYHTDDQNWIALQDWVKGIDTFSFERAVDGWANIPERIWWLYVNVGFDNIDRDHQIMEQTLNIDRIEGLWYSDNIKGSRDVHYSTDVIDSSNISKGRHVQRSSGIFQSDWVTESRFVFESSLVIGSQNVHTGQNISNSAWIANSNNIINSWSARNSSLLQDCALCADSTGLKNCMLCFGLSNCENHIFNQPVDTAFIEMLRTTLIPARQTVDFINEKNVAALFGYTMSDESRALIRTLPHFNTGIAYAITLDPAWLKGK